MQDVVSISPVNLGAVLISGILNCHSLWCCAVVMHHIVHAFLYTYLRSSLVVLLCQYLSHGVCVCVCVLVSFAELQEWKVCCVLDRNTGWFLGSVYSMLSLSMTVLKSCCR